MSFLVKVKEDVSSSQYASRYRGQVVEVEPFSNRFYDESEGLVQVKDYPVAVFNVGEYDQPTAIELIQHERERQKSLSFNADEFDKGNSRNDWVAYIGAYVGDAADKMLKNERNGEDFRSNLVKAGALIVAALEAQDKGYI
jgi:hypothetical protein